MCGLILVKRVIRKISSHCITWKPLNTTTTTECKPNICVWEMMHFTVHDVPSRASFCRPIYHITISIAPLSGIMLSLSDRAWAVSSSMGITSGRLSAICTASALTATSLCQIAIVDPSGTVIGDLLRVYWWGMGGLMLARRMVIGHQGAPCLGAREVTWEGHVMPNWPVRGSRGGRWTNQDVPCWVSRDQKCNSVAGIKGLGLPGSVGQRFSLLEKHFLAFQ